MTHKASNKVKARKKRIQPRVTYEAIQNENAVNELFDYLLDKFLDKTKK